MQDDSMDAKKKVFSNVAYLSIDWISIAVLSVLCSFIMLKTLLPQQYGVIVTTINFATIISTFALLGFSSALPKLIPEYLQKKEFKTVNALLRFSLKIILVSSVLFSILIILGTNIFSDLINLPKDALIVGSVFVFFMATYSVLGSILQGFQNMRWLFITDVTGYLVKLALLVLLFFIGMNYIGALIAALLAYAIISILRFKISWLRGKGDHVDRKSVIFDYAFAGFISSIALLVFMNSQTIILSSLQNLSEAGIYGTAMTLCVPIFAIPNVLTSALFPVISQLSAVKRKEKQQGELINLVLRYTLFIVVPLIVVLAFFSNTIILLFARAEYAGASKLLPMIATASLAYGVGSLFLSSLYAIKKPFLYRNIILLNSFIFIILSAIMTILWSSYGLAFAYLLSTFSLVGTTLYYLRKHVFMKSPMSYILKIIAASFLLYIALLLIDTINTGFFVKLSLTAVGGIIYLLVLIPLRFYTQADIQILEYASDKVPKLRKVSMFVIKLISKYVS
jgi:O-antigen/teichoic acid export membrane protein